MVQRLPALTKNFIDFFLKIQVKNKWFIFIICTVCNVQCACLGLHNKSWSSLLKCCNFWKQPGSMYNIYVQYLCTGSMYWIYVLDLCTGSMYWIYVLDLCPGSMYNTLLFVCLDQIGPISWSCTVKVSRTL